MMTIMADVPALCDVAFHCPSNHKNYAFRGDLYWRCEGQRVDRGYPRKISDGWPGIPPGIEAAYQPDGGDKIYFIKGDQYWRYSKSIEKVDQGYPRKVSSGLEGRVVGVPPLPSLKKGSSVYVFRNGHTYVYTQDDGLRLPIPQNNISYDSPFGSAHHEPHELTFTMPVASKLLKTPAMLTPKDIDTVDRFQFGFNNDDLGDIPSPNSGFMMRRVISKLLTTLKDHKEDGFDDEKDFQKSITNSYL
eukprot:NODE_4572_length_1147_cov_42.676758_g4054_i0.p1 GENE.NODE_4572_length_1147_cov_42.676758_g4054_i0~~NODE_4572_length_1147_cov_42.676758_g4054_i0.p1  ORF type:complete len:266 (+),score=45.29 NODE_4572_length_1147_cov_42.676758_g4054_i0:62-799(+)